ncbi:MAG: cell shape determination protein CcmA [Proteobacteria bacterium SG_bin5]|nr:MAG: cell shape determination protein CcmA [Proteobacteria bacterium SG_bin5]
MFNNNRGRDGAPTPVGTSSGGGKRIFSVLGADVRVVGNVSATADLHLDGTIEGDLACASLVQGAEGRVIGNVRAENARLAGTVEGSVSARTLTIERSARIAGDVEYESIEMETGARIDGRLRHADASPAPSPTPALVEVLPPVIESR